MNRTFTTEYGPATVVFLTILSGAALFGLGCAALFVATSAVSRFYPSFMAAGTVLLAICAVLALAFMIFAIVSVLRRRETSSFISTRFVLMKYLTPVARSLAKRLGMDPDKTVRSFICLSNEFILNSLEGKPVENVMILLPHCIQLQSCGMKLTSNIRNCRKCGKCAVHRFIELSDRLAVDIFVASGGTVARRQVSKSRPDIILAVACERDLLSGIRDTLPVPVIGILNERPEGPCVNTTVDIEKIAYLLERIKKPASVGVN